MNESDEYCSGSWKDNIPKKRIEVYNFFEIITFLKNLLDCFINLR